MLRYTLQLSSTLQCEWVQCFHILTAAQSVLLVAEWMFTVSSLLPYACYTPVSSQTAFGIINGNCSTWVKYHRDKYYRDKLKHRTHSCWCVFHWGISNVSQAQISIQSSIPTFTRVISPRVPVSFSPNSRTSFTHWIWYSTRWERHTHWHFRFVIISLSLFPYWDILNSAAQL